MQKKAEIELEKAKYHLKMFDIYNASVEALIEKWEKELHQQEIENVFKALN